METAIVSFEEGVVDQIFVKENVIVQEGEPLIFVRRNSQKQQS